MTPLLIAITLGLFSFRLTHLFARDFVTQPIRTWLIEKGHLILATLVECYWCLGTYWSLIFSAVLWVVLGAFTFVPLFFIASAVGTGLVGEFINYLDND